MLIFLFNLSYKSTFYDMQFRRYTIVANSAIVILCDFIRNLLSTCPCLQSGISSDRIFMMQTYEDLQFDIKPKYVFTKVEIM